MKKSKWSVLIVLFTMALAACEQRTSDLMLAQLHGPVKSVTMVSYACNSRGRVQNKNIGWNKRYYAFDHNGMFTNGFIESEDDDTTVVRYQRNEEGQIILVQNYLKEWNKWLDTKYTYNDDGTVASYQKQTLDGVSLVTCQYEGKDLSVEKEIVTVGEPFIGITEYTVMEIDSHDNWTKCLAKVSYNISGELSREYRLDVRQIEYY